MSNQDLSDLLGSIDHNSLLNDEPLKPTKEEVDSANKILADSLKNQQALPHANYRKFDPLNQKNTGFDIPSFGTPQELVDIIDEFFKQVEHPDPAMRVTPSPSALAMHLNISRKKLFALEEKPVYGPIILAAKTRLEAYLESALMDSRRTNSGGIALVLKNGFDWKEKQEVSGELTFTVTRQMFSEQPNQLTSQEPQDA